MATAMWTLVQNSAISSDWNLILNAATDYDILPTRTKSYVLKEQVCAERHFWHEEPKQIAKDLSGGFEWLRLLIVRT